VAFALKWEGSAYHPKQGSFDPNPTYKGVTQTTYDRYRLAHDLPSRPVFEIETTEWADIFLNQFWLPAGCDRLPEPLDIVVGDAAFNCGPKQAIKFLQRAVGVQADGVLGPKTLEAVKAINVREACIRVQGQRVKFYRFLKTKNPAAPLDGWLNRVNDLSKLVGIA